MSRTRSLLFALLFAFTAAGVSTANDVYIAQNAQGANSGVDCAEAHDYSFFNTGSNWGTGASQIGPGTTVHLCGTFSMSAGASGVLTIQGNGSNGNPITIKFESGALATAPYWGRNGFIYAGSSRSYITIDGAATGSNFANTFTPVGKIVATASGASAGQGAGSTAVAFRGTGSHDITVKNLTCENMFIAVKNSGNNETTGGAGTNSSCFTILDPLSNVTIQNNYFHDAFDPIYIYYNGAGRSNYVITGNKLQNLETNIVGSAGSGATLNGLTITNNDVSNMGNWDTSQSCGGGCPNHHEFFHLWAVHSGSSISNLTFAGNYLHGTLGYSMTAELYLECSGSCTSPGITATLYNNIVSMDDTGSDIFTGAGGNGMTECEGGNCHFYNNTFVSTVGHGSSSNNGIHFENGSAVISENNIFSGMSGCVANGGGTLSVSNSNDAYNLAAPCSGTNIVTGNPLLNADYRLQAGSAAIQNALNVASLGLTALDSDRAGVARPSTGSWDIGAYQSSASGTAPAPPSGLQALVQ